MTIIRTVTGHDSSGRSIIIDSSPLAGVESFTHSPGFSAAVVWQTDPQPKIVNQPVDPTAQVISVVPPPGGTSALLVTFPPDSLAAADGFNPVAAGLELCERLPGLGERFEVESPGFHRTDTIDYAVVLEGEVDLLLDDGCTTRVRQGAVVMQMGTRHAWRNPGNTSARLLFVLVGANRSETAG
jgi:hypothetical protein